MIIMTLILLSHLGAAPARQQATAPLPSSLIRVAVRTDDVGDPGELSAREESLRDLKSALAGKRKTIAVVDGDDEDLADLVVDVVSRGYVVPKIVIGLRPRPGASGIGTAGPLRTPVLRVEIGADEAVVAFTNKNKPTDSAIGWRSAADNIAGQIEKWIVDHRTEILQRRGGGSRPGPARP